MHEQLGSLVFSKNSWGKNQIKQVFGYELIKSNYNPLELSKILWANEVNQIGFGQISNLIVLLDSLFSQGIPTYGYRAYICHLRQIWEENVNELEFNSAQNEFLFAKCLINKMKAECHEGTIIGKNQIIKALYKNALDSLDVV